MKIQILMTAFFLLSIMSGKILAHSEDENIGWVTKINGAATITHKGAAVSMKEGTEVFLNDEIKTGKNSMITIELDDDSILTIGEESRIKISKWVYDQKGKKNLSAFKLYYGRARGLLNSIFGASSAMSFETSTSVAGVKGSDISVWVEDGETSAAVLEGEGFIKQTDPKFPETIKINAGLMAKTRRGMKIDLPRVIPPEVRERIGKLLIERNRELLKNLREKREGKRKILLERRKRLRERLDKKLKGRVKKSPPLNQMSPTP